MSEPKFKKLEDAPMVVVFGKSFKEKTTRKGPMECYFEKVMTVQVKKSPYAVGHSVLFAVFQGRKQLLHGTCKIDKVENDGHNDQVDLKIIQTDEKSLEDFEEMFEARQEGLTDWMKEVIDVG